MIGRERNRKAPSADLLVCFPTRSHLTLMPKPTCSPSRPNEPNKRFLNHHIRKSNGSSSHRNTSMLLSKTKHMESDMSEPTSPKVTCAGQIKVRPRNGGSCKNWQSVMEEIEKLHNNNKKTKKVKKPGWMEALGLKKDVMQFLTCLRTVRFDFRCFGSFPSANISSSDDEDDDTDDEDEDEEEEVDDDKFEKNQEEENEGENSKAVFSKWFMVLQENQNIKEGFLPTSGDDDHVQYSASVPPPNALLLMRCRSAPAKSWLEEKEEEEPKEEEEEEKENEREAQMVNEEEGSRKMILEENNLVVMNYDTDFYKLSSDIAKETWVVSGINKDQMSRSRSCKR